MNMDYRNIRRAVVAEAHLNGYSFGEPVDLFVELLEANGYLYGEGITGIMAFNTEGRGEKLGTFSLPTSSVSEVMFGSVSNQFISDSFNKELSDIIEAEGGDYGRYYILNGALLIQWADQWEYHMDERHIKAYMD